MTESTNRSPAATVIPRAVTDPDHLAVIDSGGGSLTYGELGDRAVRLAGLLSARGLVVGDVVAVLSDNNPSFLEMLAACRIAGFYYVPLNSRLTPAEIAYIINDSGARGLIAAAALPATAELTPDLIPAVEIRLLRGQPTSSQGGSGWDDYEAALATAAPFDQTVDVEGDLLQYSSGTTGRPKGIKRPLRPTPRSAAEDPSGFLLTLIGMDSESIFLCPAPMYHTAPSIWVMAGLRLGVTIVLMRKFDAHDALALIDQHRITHGQFVPTMFTRMLKLPDDERQGFDVSSLRGAVHAAAPCPVEIKRAMLDWWGPIIAEYWSSSEAAGFTFITAEEWLQHPGSVGRPARGKLHICDDDGRELPVGEPGVIWAEGTTFNYLNDPAKNAETTSPQGWRTVGDVGRFDQDGYLYLTDRASFTIITGGVNVYPQEAENVLIEHPLVYDAAVVGLPDHDLGEIAVAVVQPVDPAHATPEFAAELDEWCAARLSRYKCPRRIQFAESLPRADTGKLYKRELRDSLMRDA